MAKEFTKVGLCIPPLGGAPSVPSKSSCLSSPKRLAASMESRLPVSLAMRPATQPFILLNLESGVLGALRSPLTHPKRARSVASQSRMQSSVSPARQQRRGTRSTAATARNARRLRLGSGSQTTRSGRTKIAADGTFKTRMGSAWPSTTPCSGRKAVSALSASSLSVWSGLASSCGCLSTMTTRLAKCAASSATPATGHSDSSATTPRACAGPSATCSGTKTKLANKGGSDTCPPIPQGGQSH